MGGFGSILGALSTEIGGAAEGIQARKDREARARQQMIENSLRAEAERNLSAYRGAQIQHLQQPKPVKPVKAAASPFRNLAPGSGIYNATTGQVVRPATPRPVSARATAGANQVTPELTDAAIDNADRAVQEMERLARSGQGSQPPSMVQRGAAGLAGRLLGPQVEAAALQSQLSPDQQQFQGAADRFLHNYGSLLPKGGRSVAILQNLRNSFVAQSGQTDPTVIRNFVREARSAIENLKTERHRTTRTATPSQPTGSNSILDRP